MNKMTHPTSDAGQGHQSVAPLPPMRKSETSFAPTPETTPDLRRAFGRFGTGVTVVTTQSELGPLGMTANSFSSISLDPPLVMWSPGVASDRHNAFTRCTDFCIHVLAADQLPLALHFASQGHDFDGFDWAPNSAGTPCFAGCLATFHCASYAVHPAGDHSLVLGKVLTVTQRTDAAAALLFQQGSFGHFTPQ